MKLTKHQKKHIRSVNFDIISHEVKGKESNTNIVTFTPQDGDIYFELCEAFELTGMSENIKLLVVATQEGDRDGIV